MPYDCRTRSGVGVGGARNELFDGETHFTGPGRA